MSVIPDMNSLPSLEEMKNIASRTVKNDERNTVSKDEFLKLLIAQLKNQDPLNPLKDTEFVSQLATFTTLERITNMGEMVEKMMDSQRYLNAAIASGLIGREVTTFDGEKGVVEGVAVDETGVYLNVNGKAVAFGDVRVIEPASSQV